LQSELGLLLARAAIESDEVARAGELLERIAALDLAPAEHAQARYLTGVARARAGRSDDAEEIWEGLQDHADPRTRLRARLALMELRLSNDRIDQGDALHALDHDRPLWRGHPDEPAMLDRMATLQLETGALGNAVRTWDQVRERFPEVASERGIEKRMAEALTAALLGRDPSLGPVRAYALYLDFAALIPAGAVRGPIVRRLADQLAGLDLVAQAADLLGGLIDEQLAPGERAALGARIAELRLREPDANAALHALEATEGQGEPPDPWMARREALRAQALERLERTSEALVRPADPPGPAERRAGAKPPRRTGDVVGLTRRLEARLAQNPNAAAPLTPEQQRLVLELALAHGGEGDVEALGRLAVRFAEAMAGAQAEQAFAMATMVGPPPSETEAALAHAGAQLKRVEDYLRTAHGNG
ncbi:MAG: hypothetical protein ACREH3_10240, partial [Geminicoccales bacterium]